MRRIVDLNQYLPSVVGDALEIKEMNRVESEEMTRAWEEAERVFYNRWILTADETGIARYESMLALAPNGTLEERRRRVHFEWSKYTLYTERSVRRLFAQLYGPDRFVLDIFHNQYIVRFALIIPNDTGSLDEVYRQLRSIIPANLWIEFALQVQADLLIESSFDHYAWKYAMCGEHNSGEWPYTVTKGLIFDEGLGLDTILEGRMQTLRKVSKRSFMMPHELIYPVEHRDRTVIFDGGNAHSMPSILKTVQSGEVR